jgi:hypothetical protein
MLILTIIRILRGIYLYYFVFCLYFVFVFCFVFIILQVYKFMESLWKTRKA